MELGVRALERCDLMGAPPYSERADQLTRRFLTCAHAASLEALSDWMTAAGMSVRRDLAANLIGRYEGLTPTAPALMIGSHIDSVRNAGRYDGPLGVMLGIECVAALSATGRRPPFALEVIALGDEEGSRFPAAMLCSQAVAGTLDPASLAVTDREGVSLAEAMAPLGLAPRRFAEAARPKGSVIAFLEAHIEQGPVLEAEGLALGVVTGIAAQLRLEARFNGVAGHAGTTAMGLRRDALAGAAEAVLAIETIAARQPGPVVATVGQMAVGPGAPNVVPGRAVFSIDIRAAGAEARNQAAAEIQDALRKIADRRGLGLEITKEHDLPASPCDPRLTDHLGAAIEALGLKQRRLASGAGHDAMVMAALCPTAMLFIRCAGGISHNPAESVDPADAGLALAAMLGFIDRLESEA